MERQPDLMETEEIDLRQYVGVILKWKWMILLFMVGAILTSYIVSSFLITPIYETTAVLMATQPNYERIYREESGSLESTVDSFSRLPILNLNTFIGQLKNTEILESVIERLHLEKLNYTPRSLAQAITVTGNEKTNMIEIKVLNTDPELAESISNTLIEEFYAFLFASNQKQAKESVAYLATQLEQTEEELKKVSEEYQKNQSQARNTSILEKELMSKTEVLTNSQTLLLQSQVELEQLLAGKKRLEENLANTPAKLVTRSWTEGGIASEITEELAPEMEIGNNNMVSEEINPLYLELIKELNQKDAEIAQTEAKIAGLTANISILEKEIANIQVEVSERQLEDATVRRKLAILENAYAVLNDKIIQTEIAKSADFGRMSLTMVSPASLPNSPVKPNKPLNLAIAAVLGLMSGTFLAFVLEFFDDTIKTAEDLKKFMEVPMLASIPAGKQNN
jgi:succinoglycan biosynthesis transport protein ExoP